MLSRTAGALPVPPCAAPSVQTMKAVTMLLFLQVSAGLMVIMIYHEHAHQIAITKDESFDVVFFAKLCTTPGQFH